MREGCPDVLAHGSAPVTADCGEGIEGLLDVLGRIPRRPTVSDTSIRANTYLIFETRLGYVSKTYPTRIRIRYLSDTRYASL